MGGSYHGKGEPELLKERCGSEMGRKQKFCTDAQNGSFQKADVTGAGLLPATFGPFTDAYVGVLTFQSL